MRSLSISGVVGFVFLLANGIHAQELTAIAPPAPADHPSSFMHVFSAAEPPHGFVAFCQEDPDECTASSNTEKLVAVSPGRLRELDEVNRWVNQSIMPQTDFEHYGVKEYWTIPIDGKGDCEDYALLKRHMLMQRGWPSSALLMTVVIDESGEGHAVLTARTQAGDLILDNKVKDPSVDQHALRGSDASVVRQSSILGLSRTSPGESPGSNCGRADAALTCMRYDFAQMRRPALRI
jgi:predicted transglutaminase-like cysteine proteinase